jgi:endonuclease-3
MNQKKRQAIFDRLSIATPEPTTELNYRSNFELLIAVVLSAQATDKGVNKATNHLFAIANTPQTILNLGLDGLKKYVNTIGLYNTKSENIIKLCQRLLDLHAGEVPQTRNELEALAGVGRKLPMLFLILPLDSPLLPWTLIYIGFQIEQALPLAIMF